MLLLGKGPSARALREALLIPKMELRDDGLYFRRVAGRLRNGRVRMGWVNEGAGRHEPLVMWGISLHPNHWLTLEERRVLNRRIVSDKILQLRRFWNRGVPAPVVALCNAGEMFTVPAGRRDGDWLARKRHHFGGHDIIGPIGFEALSARLLTGSSDYGVQVIDKRHEWRVHLFLGEVLRIAHKIPHEDAGVVWNQESSHFRYDVQLRDETHLKLATLAKDAVASLSMDFGAVDIIRDREGEYYVLEVNSAPGIADNSNTLAAYVRAIQEWVNG